MSICITPTAILTAKVDGVYVLSKSLVLTHPKNLNKKNKFLSVWITRTKQAWMNMLIVTFCKVCNIYKYYIPICASVVLLQQAYNCSFLVLLPWK